MVIAVPKSQHGSAEIHLNTKAMTTRRCRLGSSAGLLRILGLRIMGMAMQSLRLREIQILLIQEIVIFTTLDKGLSVFMAKPGRAHPIVQVHLICAAFRGDTLHFRIAIQRICSF